MTDTPREGGYRPGYEVAAEQVLELIARLGLRPGDPAELRAVEEAAAVCRHGFDTGRQDLFDEGDDAFHTAIATASHNMFLQIAVREARRLQAQSSLIGLRGSVGGHAAKAVEEHDAIYQAIRAGDAEAAAHAAATHIDNTLDDYRREIQQRLFSSD
ncbi:FadR family transcriptional regulator [Microbispora triticiradicis]|uniref:FadR family transcriptional regulator n=1 Tax=Microbispora triticiradicis TaxID=2200763 RepID=A0ABX9LKJ6_9ACTN|nr:FCD domain-containing protein [Microbispora triticiradicis]RGA04470.1 FadR family transcriptional regulator [Microbispora triticiradicis]